MEFQSNSSAFTVRGRVSSGLGEGRKFASLSWFRSQVKELLGFEPYPGTLNLLLDNGAIKRLKRLFFNRDIGYEIRPRGKYFSGRIYKAIIMPNIPGAIVRPFVPNYPKNILEVIAPIYLRGTLNLNDGDDVEVKIFLR
jgi:riboflavin kinase